VRTTECGGCGAKLLLCDEAPAIMTLITFRFLPSDTDDDDFKCFFDGVRKYGGRDMDRYPILLMHVGAGINTIRLKISNGIGKFVTLPPRAPVGTRINLRLWMHV